MTHQASKLLELVRSDAAARQAKQQAVNAADRARLYADAAERDRRWLERHAASSPLARAAYELTADGLTLYETDR